MAGWTLRRRLEINTHKTEGRSPDLRSVRLDIEIDVVRIHDGYGVSLDAIGDAIGDAVNGLDKIQPTIEQLAQKAAVAVGSIPALDAPDKQWWKETPNKQWWSAIRVTAAHSMPPSHSRTKGFSATYTIKPWDPPFGPEPVFHDRGSVDCSRPATKPSQSSGKRRRK